MHIEVDKTFAMVCYGYVACLVGSLLWYGVRRSRIPRFILGLMILLPAILSMATGISALSTGGFHTSDSRSLIIMIGIGMCVVGMFMAFFAVRLLTRPSKLQKKEEA